jgi:hypothetical protein
MVAHLAMEEAADRASTLVNEDHVITAMTLRGISVDRTPVVSVVNGATDNGSSEEPGRGFFHRLFARRSAK